MTLSAGFISMAFLFYFISKDLPRQGSTELHLLQSFELLFCHAGTGRRGVAPFPIAVHFTEEFAVRFAADLCGDPPDHVYIIVRYFL